MAQHSTVVAVFCHYLYSDHPWTALVAVAVVLQMQVFLDEMATAVLFSESRLLFLQSHHHRTVHPKAHQYRGRFGAGQSTHQTKTTHNTQIHTLIGSGAYV